MANNVIQNLSLVCKRLLIIEGHSGKLNDVIFRGKMQKPASNVIFFGGDMQDFSENMLAHRDSKAFEKWNLEHTAKILHNHFQDSHIWIVKPCRMHLKTFSVFSNFVESNDFGVPEHSSEQASWNHLSKLFENSMLEMQKENLIQEKDNANGPMENNDLSKAEIFTADSDVILIGFSKGCVVLNQLLYDLQSAKKDKKVMEFVDRVKAIYWLDGGHCGGSKTWITDKDILGELVDRDLTVYSHVTPYQVKDEMRKWIGKEQKKFVEILKDLNVKVVNKVHFEGEDRSVENHFEVLHRL